MQNKHNISSNVGWLFITKVFAQVIQVIIATILTRLILPKDYGVIAIVMVIITFCEVFIDFGLATALIQKKNATQEDYSSVFYMNIILSIVMYIFLFFLAPVISSYYGTEYLKLTTYIRVVGLILITYGINSVQNAYIAKNLLFKKTFKITFFSVIISGTIAIILAYILPQDQRIWALVAEYLISSIFITCSMWFRIGWRPKFVFSIKCIKPFLKFGWKVLAKSLIDAINSSVRKLIIGKQYTSADLAFYDRGQQYPLKLVKPVDYSIGTVLFPILSNSQDDSSKTKKIARQVLQMSTYIIFPMIIGFACVAPNFVKSFLTDAWIPIIPYLQIFCFVSLFRPLTGIQMRLLLAIGRSDITLKCEMQKGIIDVIIILITISFGVFWIAIGMLISAFAGFLIYYIAVRKKVNYKLLELLNDIKYSVLLTLIMSIFVLIIGNLELKPIILLSLQMILGSALYILLSFLTKNKNYIYIIDLFKKRFSKGENNINEKNTIKN